LGGTLDMDQSEVGAYIRLLCIQWNRGSIPVEPDRVARLAGGSVSDHVLSKFPTWEDGLRRNHRLEQERKKQADYSEKQRLKGVQSGKSRGTEHKPKKNRGSTVVQPDTQPEVNLPFPSPSPIPFPTPVSDSNSIAATAAPPAAKVKARNLLFDALAEIEGGADKITEPMAAAIGTALSHIKKASPDVTPDEIRKRTANLPLHMPSARATATSLSKHWARCAAPPVNGGGNHSTPTTNPRNEWIGTPESRAQWERESAARRAAAEKRIVEGEIPFS
jgi:uncharacterized protein YdaU (DUF1376 family)